MEKRLKDYLARMEQQTAAEMTEEERRRVLRDLLTNIGFFQHERLVHLIVTVVFALLTVMSMLISLLLEAALGFILPLAFMVLLVPYIRHYYILENGVQKLYTYYDRLSAGLG